MKLEGFDEGLLHHIYTWTSFQWSEVGSLDDEQGDVLE